MLGLSRIAVYKKVKAGKIKATKVGRIHVISDPDIGKVLQENVDARDRTRLDRAVRRVVREYGDVLKRLARE